MGNVSILIDPTFRREHSVNINYVNEGKPPSVKYQERLHYTVEGWQERQESNPRPSVLETAQTHLGVCYILPLRAFVHT